MTSTSSTSGTAIQNNIDLLCDLIVRTIEQSLSFIGTRPQLPLSAVGISVRGEDIAETGAETPLKSEEEYVWHVFWSVRA